MIDRSNINQATVGFVGFDRFDPSPHVLKNIVLNKAGLKESSDPQIVVCAEDSDSIKVMLDEFPASTVRILFNCEMGAVDFNLFDYVIGWENLQLSPRYARMHPVLRITGTPFLVPAPQSLESVPFPSRGFCSFVYSNSRAHPMRDVFFKHLNEKKMVSSWGSHLNNSGTLSIPGSSGGYEDEKLHIESNYKFSIAFENGIYGGYTTEKLFSSVAAGAIPIYWGNPEIGLDVNLKRIISVHEFNDLDACIEEVLKLENAPERLADILSQPLMTRDQENLVKRSEDDLVGLFRHASKTAMEGRVMRPTGTTRTTVESTLLPMLKREKRIARRKYLVSRFLQVIGALEPVLKIIAKARELARKP